MYEIQTNSLNGKNYYAGTFPVASDCIPVEEGADIPAHTPVALSAGGSGAGKAVILTADNINDLIGITTADSTESGVMVDFTGEFFINSLNVPDGVDTDKLTDIARRINIYLR